MICRLCLCDLENSVSISIYSDAEHGLPKLIAKYLQLELSVNDNISNRLCTPCWRYLTEFEQFCIMVAEQQQMLLLKTEPEPPPEPAVVVWNTEATPGVGDSKLSLSFDNDVKDHILCEPEIDVNDQVAKQLNSDDDDDDDEDEDAGYADYAMEGDAFADEEEFEPVAPSTATPKQRKGKTRQTAAAKEVRSTVVTSLRESRARSRELRRNAAASVTQTEPDPVPVPAPAPKAASVTASPVATKRGRPKGAVKGASPKVKRPKMDGEKLIAKRSSIKEMDDYIAANVKLDCCLCAAPLQNFIELKRHFRAAHKCTGYMECCNNRYKKRTLYVDHLHYHKDPQYFSCKPCRKSFLNRNSQDMHMLRFHSDQQQLVHQCGICEARFAKKFLLTMHIKGHKGTERTEACDTCSKTFRTKLELTAHVKRMHTSDFTLIICDICGVNFRSKANFLIHKKALHPDGPVAEVQCNLCSRWLRDERSLRKHLARHDDREGNNKYRCLLCSAEKASRVALSSHMRYHHSAKRHSCTLCGKEFKLPRALAEHMATHTGIDLYSCQFCTRTFKSHANMHNHKKKMHPNEWVRKYSQPSGQAAIAGGGGGGGAAATMTTTLDTALDSPIPMEEEEEEVTQQTASDASGSYHQFISNGGAVCPL
ncbi:transcription factor grauzone-like [Drosophila nasuta]|uniref:transcription factor grauzone-like n=1 Tax=Drosophila nasuta TaxID=42062 RepID=UPI00295E995C|nr:transcription factor grauzone-like [Drosophila nasuta]